MATPSRYGGGTKPPDTTTSRATRASSSQPSRYGGSGGSQPQSSASSSGSHSIGGFIHNLGSDISDTVYGFVPGVKAIAEHPIRTGGEIAHSYKVQYAPLFHQISAQVQGHWADADRWRKVADQTLYDHPLGPITDLVAIATGGASLGVRAGLLPETAGRAIELTAPSGKIVEKALSPKPLRGYIQATTDQALKKVSKPETRGIGEYSRAAKVERAAAAKDSRANQVHLTAFNKAIKSGGKTDEAKVATYLLATMPLPDALAKQVEHLRQIGNHAEAEIIMNPKVQEIYLNPGKYPKVQKALKAISDIGAAKEKVLGTTLADKAAADRPYLHMRLAMGARYVDKGSASRYAALAQKQAEPVVRGFTPDMKIRVYKIENDLVPNLEKEITKQEAWVKELDSMMPGRSRGAAAAEKAKQALSLQGSVQTNLAKAKFKLDRLRSVHSRLTKEAAGIRKEAESTYLPGGYVTPSKLPTKEGLHGGPAIKDIQRMLDEQGRPSPAYIPDVMLEKATPAFDNFNAGGLANPRGVVKMNKGVLFEMGKMIMDPAVLGPNFMGAVKYAHHLDIYNRMLASARRLPSTEPLPDGWRYVRRVVKPEEEVVNGKRVVTGKTSETISHTTKNAAEYDKWLNDVREGIKPADSLPPKGDPFSTASTGDAVIEGDHYLVVPKSYADGLAGEFTRTNRFVYLMNKGPLRVWRALVLNLRPAWLINNVVGNTLMYLMHNASPEGIKNLALAFKKMASPADAKGIDSLIYKHFGSQLNATFIGTQRPTGFFKGHLTGAVAKVVGTPAELDKAYETVLRKAAVRTAVKKNPALRRAARRMQGETKDFWDAASQALDENPILAQQVEDKVNVALGNFTSMGKFEKEALRSIFPFYAWYKAITGVVLKLPLEQPAKVSLLTRLDAIGAEQSLSQLGVNREDVPAWARGLVVLGGEKNGRFPVFNFGGTNPYTTVPQEGDFARSLLAGKPGSVGQTLPGLNPIISAALATIIGKNPQTGAPLPQHKVAGMNIAGIFAGLESLGEGLPQVRLGGQLSGHTYTGKPGKPTLYEHTPASDALRYGGFPWANVSVPALKRMQEKTKNGAP